MMRKLCRLADLAPGEARGFGPAYGGFTGLFAVRGADAVHVYVNACPHVGVALDRPPGQFLARDGTSIVCRTHGAVFGIVDGVCTAGPCVGEALERVAVTIDDGWVLVEETAGL